MVRVNDDKPILIGKVGTALDRVEHPSDHHIRFFNGTEIFRHGNRETMTVTGSVIFVDVEHEKVYIIAFRPFGVLDTFFGREFPAENRYRVIDIGVITLRGTDVCRPGQNVAVFPPHIQPG